MKLSSKISAVALLASLIGVSASHNVLAVEDTAEMFGTGRITFTHNETENPIVTPPVKPGGEGEDGDIEGEVEIPTNPSTASMKIIAVSDLDFSSKELDLGGNQKVYNALPYKATIKKDGVTSQQEMAHFVAFQDFRTDHKNNFYTISAKITKQFSQGAGKATLDGATLTYSNMSVTTATHKGREPEAKSEETVINAIDTNPVLIQKTEGKGQGAFNINFGSIAEQTAGESVKLTIPGSTSLVQGQYDAEVTWYITDAK